MKKEKILSNGHYSASGYGRGRRNNVTIYLINGKAYARDKERADSSFDPCKGELSGYVRINQMKGFGGFYQVSTDAEHEDYITKEILIQMLANAKKTYAGCGGHGKAAANLVLIKEYTKELELLGVEIPSDKELYEMGEFNGRPGAV